MSDPGSCSDGDAIRPSDGRAGFADSLTFSWGDPRAEVHGTVRLGAAPDGAGGATASALVLAFLGQDPVLVAAAGGEAVAEVSWSRVRVAGVAVEELTDGEGWRVTFDDDSGSLLLDFRPTSPPVVVGPEEAAASAAGLEGSERLCRVAGELRTAGGVVRTIDGLGQRGRQWGAPDWEEMELTRTVGLWLEEGAGAVLASVRGRPGRRETGHEGEAISAWVVETDDTGETLVAPIADPRVSTSYDGEGRQRRAGLELWRDEDAPYPIRAAGEVVCGTSLELGRLRLDCAFLTWRSEGRVGTGRYDVLRRLGE